MAHNTQDKHQQTIEGANMVVNRAKMREILGIAQPTFSKWLVNGLPRTGEGNDAIYDTKEVIEWLINREKGKLLTDEDGKVYDLNGEKARLAYHQANNEALKEAQNRGELISAEDVVKEWGNAILAMRGRLLALPSKIAKTAINADSVKEIERNTEKLVHEALEELSIYESTETSTETSVKTSETTAKADDKPVGRQVSKTKRGG